jgi:hypothetical protein
MRANYDRNIGWKSRSTAFSKPQCGRPVRWRSSMCSMLSQPLLSPWRDGPHGRGVIGATRRRDRPDRSASPRGRDWSLRDQAWARFGVGHRMVSISATRLSRSQASISAGRRSFSGPVRARRASSRQAMPNGSTRPRWSRQRLTVRALLSGSPAQVTLVPKGGHGIN